MVSRFVNRYGHKKIQLNWLNEGMNNINEILQNMLYIIVNEPNTEIH